MKRSSERSGESLRIRLRIGASGVLQELGAEGHAGFGSKGEDVVCAAASALMRTVARTFEAADGFAVDGSAQRRGELRFSVRHDPEGSTDWAKGVTDTFLRGIEDLAQEFPDHIQLTISKD